MLLGLLTLGVSLLLPGSTSAQAPWSGILNPSRAVDWTVVPITLPNFSAACSTQPSLVAGSGNASANATSIANSIASCDSSHNVVNIPAGTFYVAGIQNNKSNVVLRGAGPTSTYLFLTSGASRCSSAAGGANVCIESNPFNYAQGSNVLPGGSNSCTWSSGYAQGSTTITLTNCGSAPPSGQTLILDQQNDVLDTGGDYICDTWILGCTWKGQINTDPSGRVGGSILITHSQQQVVQMTSVSGSGTYTVTINPPVYFNNVRSSQAPGAWFPGYMANSGIENLSIDYTNNTSTPVGISIGDCYGCWVKNVRSINASKVHVEYVQSMHTVIRDSYFYQSQAHATQSYTIEPIESSADLVENNIFQQVTNPILLFQASGDVYGYNFSIDNPVSGSFMQGSYSSHNSGSGMNLWEGNNFNSLLCDDTWGSSSLQTYFRNLMPGWQNGFTNQTFPVSLNSWCRAYNVIGNVLGQPGYHNQYQSNATSTVGGVGSSNCNTSVFELGWSDNSGLCVATAPPVADPLVFSTLMRWGNYDTVTAAVKWDSTEASPGAVTYINANAVPSNHNLPSSLYMASKPGWWPSSTPWPLIGPDVTGGNVGSCSGGSFSGSAATQSSQCTGGSFNSSAWSQLANANPAMACYLNTMHGPADGSGGLLTFDANTCYTTTTGGQPPAAPTNLTATVGN